MEKKLEILKRAFGYHTQFGSERLFQCPKCDHHKLKLSINIEKDAFKCWVCDFSGKNISFLFRVYAPEYFRQWAACTGLVDITQYENIFNPHKLKKQLKILDLPEHFQTLTGEENRHKTRALEYLRNRGLNSEDILKWRIGFCDRGVYGGRVIVPSFDDSGNLNYFVGRTYVNHHFKYKNPPFSKDIIFNDLDINWKEDIILVEGAFDAMRCSNAIPMLGSTLKESSCLFQKICNLRPDVYLAFDKDAKEKELLVANKLRRHDVDVYIINIDPFQDIGEMKKEEIKKRKLKADFVTDTNYLKYKLNF